jgi:thiopeptide-type bacteriocin biosynthesis protein
MEPAITGAEFIYQIIQTLQKINHPPDQEITNTIDTLLQIEEQIRAIDSNGTNPVEAYKKIINLIDTLGVVYEENKLFQCDLVQYASQAQLNQKHQKELLGCLQLLNGLYTNDENDNLKLFRNRFLERYEDKEMPLLEVLDAETGIGYLEMSGKNISPLLEGIAVAPTANGRQQITWEKAQQWLFGLLNKANAAQLYEIEIREEDILDFKPDWKNLPASLSVIFRLINDERILIENFSGSSAANLLGRFAHGDKKIETLVQKITRAEQQINPNIIFAEIIHLPESRVGNILLHPVFRDYEIPYLAKSSLPESTQIALEDLYVSVQSNDIRLFSKKLNKEIIPRLSSAHNFSFNALPVYQFLCDMQSQNIRNGFSFFWGSISSGFRFLPRVVYKNVVLSEAAWQINKKEIGEFLKSSQETETGLAHQLKMPRYLVLADGDNELLVDRENAVSMMAFSDAVKNRDRIVLKEFSGYHNLPVCNEKNEFYNNQCIASLIKTIETHPGKNVSLQEPPGIQRSFVPGSEWFYAKIYCGPKSADKILEEFIGPLKEQLAEKEIIDSWFFIRYADPHFHIRLRFHVKNIQNIGTLMQMAGTVFDLLKKQSLSWNIKLDTYNRELERYAGQLCEPSESLFRADSDLVLEFLKETEGDEREQLRWLWGMKNIDFLLDCFLYTLEQKEQLLDQCRSAYGKEFNFEKFTLQSINKKYAAQRIQIESVLGAGMQETAAPIIPVAMFETNKLRLNEIAAGMLTHASGNKIPLDPLMISFMHMSLNRLFLSESRLQEAILYEFLYKWYVSLKHRKNNMITR